MNMPAASDVLRHCDLVPYEKQSNSSRTTVESKSNRSGDYNYDLIAIFSPCDSHATAIQSHYDHSTTTLRLYAGCSTGACK